MTFLLIVVGALLGPFVCAGMFSENTGWTSALFGALAGLALGQVQQLRRRIGELERNLAQQRASTAAAERAAVPAPPSVVGTVPELPVPVTASAELRLPEITAAPPVTEPRRIEPAATATTSKAPPPIPAPRPPTLPPRPPQQPDAVSQAVTR